MEAEAYMMITTRIVHGPPQGPTPRALNLIGSLAQTLRFALREAWFNFGIGILLFLSEKQGSGSRLDRHSLEKNADLRLRDFGSWGHVQRR
jgi:hypothetical protein